MEAEPLLLKNWGTWRVQSDDQCNDYHRDCQNQQAQERTYYVKSTLRYQVQLATVYKGNIIKNLIMDCQSYTKYRPNETTGGIFVSWRRKEELPTGA